MGDLIDRDKIYEAVYDLACKSVGVIGGISEDYAYGLREAAHMIEEAPAVETVPVVHSKWKLVGADKRGRGGIFVCLACDKCYPFTRDYCPNCGAKMDLEEEPNGK